MMRREQAELVLGESDEFLAVLERASSVASLDKPVLVVGERGCGKELIAARIHYLSERWQRPYVKFSCAALNEELLDSELFGHVAGAYTGATKNRVGRFEVADGGTLFVDELASMSRRLQEKLLRVIEYGEFERVGDSQTRKVDVRLVGAANVDLPALAELGLFRADLLDRLSFDVITVPPLRKRRDDILLLAQAFAEDMAKELGRPLFSGFSASVRDQLLSHDWPGNVRELRNVIERALYQQTESEDKVSRIQIDPFDSPFRPGLPVTLGPVASARNVDNGLESKKKNQEAADDSAASMAMPMDMAAEVARYEKKLLSGGLRAAHHNQRRAAELLGLSYHQLRGQLRKYDLLPSARERVGGAVSS